MRRLAAALALAVVGAFAVGCGGARSVRSVGAPPHVGLPSRSLVRTVLGGGAQRADVPADPLWQRARFDDALDRARLAGAEGAAGLFDAVLGGGEAEAVALGALPYADDAEAVLGALVTRAAEGDPSSRGARLEAILAISGRPASSNEPLEPDGMRAAAALLAALCRRTDLPRGERALAISAARALAAKGWGDASRIPTDLDPP